MRLVCSVMFICLLIAFLGFGTVFMGLESAAKTLGRNLANETVNVVSHK